MKISKAELRILISYFQGLVEMDVNGITSSDARDAVADWLSTVGQPEASKDFARLVHDYQTSPKIQKLENEYNGQ